MSERIGRWRGQADTPRGLQAILDDWLRAGASHDVQSAPQPRSPQDEYTVAAEPVHEPTQKKHLQGKSIHVV
jgi:hypothetical protein